MCVDIGSSECERSDMETGEEDSVIIGHGLDKSMEVTDLGDIEASLPSGILPGIYISKQISSNVHYQGNY